MVAHLPCGQHVVKVDGTAKNGATYAAETPTKIARMIVAIVIKFSSKSVPGDELVDQFARSPGVMMATPYLRENLSSLASRMNVKGALLPLVRMRGDYDEPNDAQDESTV